MVKPRTPSSASLAIWSAKWAIAWSGDDRVSVLIVLHEAARTGAPRIGGLIAGALKQHRDVRILCLTGGAMLDWLRERVGAENIQTIETDRPRHKVPFAERLNFAKSFLEQDPSQIVYVNSLAACEFVIAAKATGKVAVVHVHEKVEEMRKLLAIQLLKLEVLSLSDAVVLAAEDLRGDLAEVFGFLPERVINFGIAVDADEIDRLAHNGKPEAKTANGKRFKRTERLVVGMVGHASQRKGSDMFFEAARSLPLHDFIWVGNWNLDDAPENTIYPKFVDAKLANLFVSGGVNNPYKYISNFDLFFLSSREDPNPVVLAESLILGVPILAFSKTTAVTDFLARCAIVCHGHTNVEDSVRVLKALQASEVRSDAFRPNAAEYRQRFNVADKIGNIVELLDSLPA
jgi:glycosyltransferase involved in cell wall biosynthesis